MRVKGTLGLLTFVAVAAVATSLVVDCDGCSGWPVEADAIEVGGVGVMVLVVLAANAVLDLAAGVGTSFVLGAAAGARPVLVTVGADLPLVADVGGGLVLGVVTFLGVGAALIFGIVKVGGGATVDGGGTNGGWPAIADLPLAAGGVCFLVVVEAAAAAAVAAAAAAASAARVERGVIGASVSASNIEFEPVSE